MKIAIVIAAYQEELNIGSLTARLIASLDAMKLVEWRLIYVIDGEDDTLKIAQRYAEQRQEIHIIYNRQPSGLGNAFRRGFAAIPPDTDAVVTMDADLNHQPEEMTRLIGALTDLQADIVVGSRRAAGSVNTGTPFWKLVLSRIVNRVMRWLSSMPVADLTSGYRVYRYEALMALPFHNQGFAFLPEMLIAAHRLGFRIAEAPIAFIFRTAGESKMDLFATARSYVVLLAPRPRTLFIFTCLLLLFVFVVTGQRLWFGR